MDKEEEEEKEDMLIASLNVSQGDFNYSVKLFV